jgi:hypothetical protein
VYNDFFCSDFSQKQTGQESDPDSQAFAAFVACGLAAFSHSTFPGTVPLATKKSATLDQQRGVGHNLPVTPWFKVLAIHISD